MCRENKNTELDTAWATSAARHDGPEGATALHDRMRMSGKLFVGASGTWPLGAALVAECLRNGAPRSLADEWQAEGTDPTGRATCAAFRRGEHVCEWEGVPCGREGQGPKH